MKKLFPYQFPWIHLRCHLLDLLTQNKTKEYKTKQSVKETENKNKKQKQKIENREQKQEQKQKTKLNITFELKFHFCGSHLLINFTYSPRQSYRLCISSHITKKRNLVNIMLLYIVR